VTQTEREKGSQKRHLFAYLGFEKKRMNSVVAETRRPSAEAEEDEGEDDEADEDDFFSEVWFL
jgi:hypothetical protein